MRTFLKLFLLLLLLCGGLAGASRPFIAYWKERNRPEWRTAEVSKGRIVSVVNSTGSIKPVLSVSVGAFVSGPIDELLVGFNQEVKKGDVLARIDKRIYRANVDRDLATLAIRAADVERVKAQLQQALNDEKRAFALREDDETFISQAELDKFTFSRASLEAQLKVAEASVTAAEASLEFSQAQLDYTEILAPVDGMIINRKIDPGQTLAVQFQTPELFILAPDMRRQMHLHASVDEADIGLIRAAQERKLPVAFTVDAYPDDLFQGVVEEIRLSHTTTQNVVTYPVVVSAENPDLKLLPGMTASLSFEVDRREETLRVPNAALRYFPTPDLVRLDDRPLLEGREQAEAEDQTTTSEANLSADERSTLRRKRSLRHVWVVDGLLLRAVPVVTGLSDSQYTELIEGDLAEGVPLVTGVKPKRPPGG